MNKVKLFYNPLLSVSENARICGVSEAAVRKYIRVNKIDRRYEAAYSKYELIKNKLVQNPQYSIKEIAQKTSLSVNTVRKYFYYIHNQDGIKSRIDTNKVSILDTSKSENLIKSTSDNQYEILGNIIRLYIPSLKIDCDLTASKLVFYKYGIEVPEYLYDKFPQKHEISNLSDIEKLPPEKFQSIIFDLPFIVRRENTNKTSKIENRFTSFNSIEELYDTNDYMLEMSFNLLKTNGILIVKTMDINYNGKQYWVSTYIQNKANKLGFELLDIFILTSKSKILNNRGVKQHCARKFHSYFLVFKKK